MAFVKMKPPAGVTVGLGADGKQYYVNDRGFASVDSGSVTKLTNEGWSTVTDTAPGTPLENVKSQVDPVTGGVGIIGPEGKQIGGTASPYAFTTRALAEADNGQTRICASAQTATVNASMPVGFGVAFKGAISFTAGAGVTITDVRTTGAANPWCALVQTGVDTYDVVGAKA